MNMFLLKEPSRNHRVYRLLAGEFLFNCATFYTATGGGGGLHCVRQRVLTRLS